MCTEIIVEILHSCVLYFIKQFLSTQKMMLFSGNICHLFQAA